VSNSIGVISSFVRCPLCSLSVQGSAAERIDAMCGRTFLPSPVAGWDHVHSYAVSILLVANPTAQDEDAASGYDQPLGIRPESSAFAPIPLAIAKRPVRSAPRQRPSGRLRAESCVRRCPRNAEGCSLLRRRRRREISSHRAAQAAVAHEITGPANVRAIRKSPG
jgi:hypothetical protein